MGIRICYVCDDPIIRGEPRLIVSGVMIHEHCLPESKGSVCDTTNCAWQWTVHGGACVV